MRSLSALPTTLLALVATAVPASTLARAQSDATPRPDGLLIEHTDGPESCSRPAQNGDTIAVNYRGTLLSTGEEFDQSYDRGEPLSFRLGAGRVIKGWEEGLLGACVGESRKLTIPPELAYGDRGTGPIPPKATLVFETRLEEIVGVDTDDGDVEPSATLSSSASPSATSDGAFSIATVPSSPGAGGVHDDMTLEEDVGSEAGVSSTPQTECKLLGPFALLVQGALGALALLTLIWKRWREVPKRPWKIFLFDVSKQVFGSFLLHIINLAMSMIGSVDVANAAASAVTQAGTQVQNSEGRTPNPCSYYLLNLGIDTTIGVPVLYILLKILTALFAHTALARPPQSLQSGNYGQPPKVSWYGKQLFIYCIGLIGMKLFVFFLFMALPWLPWVGDWALRWTRGSEALEITFALFLFPLAMNALQYWIIDNFIMDKKKSSDGYEQVAGADDTDDERQRMISEDTDVDEEQHINFKGADELAGKDEATALENPTPVPIFRGDEEHDDPNQGSSSSSESNKTK